VTLDSHSSAIYGLGDVAQWVFTIYNKKLTPEAWWQ
jgi:hypothetical protein